MSGGRLDTMMVLGQATAAMDLTSTSSILTHFAAVDSVLTEWGYQVTTTVAGSSAAPVLSLYNQDYDVSSNSNTLDSATIAVGTAAANAVTRRGLAGTPASPVSVGASPGAGILIPAGRTVSIKVSTAAAGTPAGAARVYLILRPITY